MNPLQIIQLAVGLGALALVVVVLVETFETLVLPHRVSRQLRLTRIYFRVLWRLWGAVGPRVHAYQLRENFLSIFGPLSLLLLLVMWAALLIFAFAGLLWALGSPLAAQGGRPSFGTDLYFSSTTFLTLGLGDVTAVSPLARLLTVLEVGTGFGLIALVIGYLPVIYQAFSRREVSISLLDAHVARHLQLESCCGVILRAPASKDCCACCRSGNAGPRSCWRATSPIRRWPTFARSTITSRGWRRWRRSWMPAHWCRSARDR